MADVKIGIVGAAGRMGQALVREIARTPGAAVIGGSERPGHPGLGGDLGALAGIDPVGAVLTSDPLVLFAKAQVVIDFTTPAVVAEHADLAAQGKVAYVLGTTGLEAQHFAALDKAKGHTPIMQAYNMSLGVNLLAGLVRQTAAQLGPDWDIEIVEMHHRMKVDAPSGTAIMLGEAAAAGRGIDLARNTECGRDGITGARKVGAIGFAALRGGNVAGDHSVIFAADDERLELVHRATDRRIFARGAVRAALWAVTQPPGRYTMADVLGFSRI